MKRILLALGGVVLLLTTACGSSGHRTSASTPPATAGLLPGTTTTSSTEPDPITTDPTTTAGSTTTTVPDTSVVPTHITAAYVDAVLAKLNHVYGDAVRSLVISKKMTPLILEDLSAIYDTPLYAEEVNIFASGTGSALSDIRTDPGDRHMKIVHLIHISKTCVFAKVTIDERPVVKRAPAPAYGTYEGLRIDDQKPFTSDPDPTPWKFFADIAVKGPEKVADGCTGTGSGS